MDADRLSELKQRADLAIGIANDIKNLTDCSQLCDFSSLDYAVRNAVFLKGREAVLAEKEAMLETLLSGPASKEPAMSTDADWIPAN